MTGDIDIAGAQTATLLITDLAEWAGEAQALSFGAMLLCQAGSATLEVNYKRWPLAAGAVITLFPNDIVQLHAATIDFRVRKLAYSPALLREASLAVEHTVYSLLRQDCCRPSDARVTALVTHMMNLLQVYFDQPDCACLEQMVQLQLKAAFIGINDYQYRHPETRPHEPGSRRVNELFDEFMQAIEQHHRDLRDVAQYARLLNITPKYLNSIAHAKTGHTPKEIIDHFVVLQLKLCLRDSRLSLKQIAWLFHFSDFSFFSRYFKAHTGLTPSQYRQQ